METGKKNSAINYEKYLNCHVFLFISCGTNLKKTEFEPKGFREKKKVSKIDKTLKSCCGK